MNDMVFSWYRWIPVFCFIPTNIYTAEIFNAKNFPNASSLYQAGFGSGTLIRIPNNYKPIQELKPGDLVLDQHGHTLTVTNTEQKKVDYHIQITVNSKQIQVGCGNQFFIHYHTATAARDMKLHSYVQCANGHAQYVTVEKVANAITLYTVIVADTQGTICIAPYDIISIPQRDSSIAYRI
jgi:hypothetical protein